MPKFKLKKFPKAPKASASTETWLNYAKRKIAVNRENAKVRAEQRKHENAVRRARGIKPIKTK